MGEGQSGSAIASLRQTASTHAERVKSLVPRHDAESAECDHEARALALSAVLWVGRASLTPGGQRAATGALGSAAAGAVIGAIAGNASAGATIGAGVGLVGRLIRIKMNGQATYEQDYNQGYAVNRTMNAYPLPPPHPYYP
jgi:hypothetical protein